MSGVLTHTPAQILRQLLVDAGHGTLPASSGTWPVSANKENRALDSTITVYDDEQRDRGRVMTDGSRPVLEAYQIRFRAPTPALAWAKANAVCVALDSVYQETVSITDSDGTRRRYAVHSINRGPLIPLHETTPESSHGVFVCNCTSSIKAL